MGRVHSFCRVGPGHIGRERDSARARRVQRDRRRLGDHRLRARRRRASRVGGRPPVDRQRRDGRGRLVPEGRIRRDDHLQGVRADGSDAIAASSWARRSLRAATKRCCSSSPTGHTGERLPDVFGLNQGVFRVRVDPRTGQKMVVPPPVMATARRRRRASAGQARVRRPPSAGVRRVRRPRPRGDGLDAQREAMKRRSRALAVARPRPRPGRSRRRLPEARHARRQPDREPAVAAVSHPLLHHQRRRRPA